MMRQHMRSRLFRGLTVPMLVGAVVLVGCSPAPLGSGEPQGESRNSESVQRESASSVMSSDADIPDDPMAQDELDAEAERVYRAFFELEQDVIAAGGADELPPEMDEYIMGMYAQYSLVIYQTLLERGWRTVPGKRAEIIDIQPDHDDTYEDSLSTLNLCFDTRNSPLMTQDGEVRQGSITYNQIYLKSDKDQKLKIFQSRTATVDECTIDH